MIDEHILLGREESQACTDVSIALPYSESCNCISCNANGVEVTVFDKKLWQCMPF